MGVTGCLACIKYLVTLINFIFWLAGIALLSISVWMYIDTSSYLAGNYNDKFFISIYILMGVGSLMTLVGFLGCCGAMQESSCMLATFSTFVLLIFAAEVAGAVYGYSHQDEVKEAISKRVKVMIQDEYGVTPSVTAAIDAMQEKLQCCGADGPTDYRNSDLNKGLLEKITNANIPKSCCKDSSCTSSGIFDSGYYSRGCIEALQDKVKQHLDIIIAVGIGIAVIQVFGFVFSLVLCCAVSNERY